MFDVDTTAIPPLSPEGVDFGNDTQAGDFLDALLDDTILRQRSSDYAFAFWIAVLAIIGLFAVSNLFDSLTRALRRRRAAAAQHRAQLGQCKALQCLSKPIDILRMLSYYQLHLPSWASGIKVPSLGVVVLLLAYLGLALALEFSHDNVQGAQYWQAKGIRAGWLAVAQIPLIVLLVGKRNLISFTTGLVYHRLNVIHRWASRIMLLLAVFHVAFQAHGWSQFPGIFHLETTADSCVPTGLAAFALLVWMNISSFGFVRAICYEFFVVQHILTFFGLIIAIMLHLPTTALSSRIYVYVPVGLWLLDRLLRTSYSVYANRKKQVATLTKLPGGVTLIRTACPKMKFWRPGSHVLLSLPGLALGQSHPATIASTPTSHDGEMLFLLKSHKGFTRTLFDHASEPNKTGQSRFHDNEKNASTYRILLDGPYGGPQADFSEFRSICLIAGSTGITFVLAVLLDVAHKVRVANGNFPLRMIKVVWAVKEADHLSWVRTELLDVLRAIHESRVGIDVTVFTTEKLPADALPSGKSTLSQQSSLSDQDGNVDGVSFQAGRPPLSHIIQQFACQSARECGIAVCGPTGMNVDVRNAVTRLATHQLRERQGGRPPMFLHVEGFSY